MNLSENSPRPISTARSAALRGSWPALLRAAERARQRAARTGTALVISRDGALEHVYPQLESAPQRVQEPEPKQRS